MQNLLTKIQHAKSPVEALKFQLEYLASTGVTVKKINTIISTNDIDLPVSSELERIKKGWPACEEHSKKNLKNLVETNALTKANLKAGKANMLRLAFDGQGHTICIVEPVNLVPELTAMRISMVGKHRTESKKNTPVEA